MNIMTLNTIRLMSKEDFSNLCMNHLLVIYAFFTPISQRATSSIFVLILIFFLLRGNYIFYLKRVLTNKIVQSCLLFFSIYIIGLLWADNFKYAKTILGDMKYIIYPLVFLSFLDKRFSFKVITFFIFGMLFSELISYLITFKIIPYSLSFGDIVIYSAQQANNPTPFINHGKYNIFLSIVVGLILYKLLRDNDKLSLKLISIFFIITATINITLVGGRIGYIGYFCIILMTIAFIYRRKAFKLLVLAIMGLSVLGVLSYSSSDMFQKRINLIISDIEKLNNNQDFTTSIGVRVGLWIYSMKVIEDNPLFGVGTGDHIDEVRKLIVEKENHNNLLNYNNLHNGYIEILVQFGILGIILYLNIFYQIIKYKYLNEFNQFVIFLVSLGISVGILTGVYGGSLYLSLFAIAISVACSNNKFDFPNENSYKLYLCYLLLIIVFFTLAIVQ